MNTALLLCSIGLLAGAIFAGLTHTSRTNTVSATATWTILGGLVGFYLGMVIAASIVTEFVPQREVSSITFTLVSWGTTEGLDHTYIWGSGKIGTDASYRFIYRNRDGSLVSGQVPANNLVRIKEDKDLHQVGYWRTISQEADLSSPIASWAILPARSNHIITEEFRVPVGTVVQGFRFQ